MICGPSPVRGTRKLPSAKRNDPTARCAAIKRSRSSIAGGCQATDGVAVSVELVAQGQERGSENEKDLCKRQTRFSQSRWRGAGRRFGFVGSPGIAG